MARKRRLSDLYVVGREVTIDDGEGGITVWLKKLNPLEMEDTLRRANAARATALSMRNDEDSIVRQSLANEVDDMSEEEMVEYITDVTVGKRASALEAEEADQEEWSKDGYLQGLRDSWEDKYWKIHAEDPANDEAKHVLDELSRFNDVLQKRIDAESASVKESYTGRPIEILMAEVLETKIQYEADMEWMREYRFSEIYHATRISKDDKSLYFENRAELDSCESAVYLRLLRELAEISVDSTEGKSSGATATSSPSSEQPVTPATEEPSGLAVVGV